jgi:hypothetical protein
MDRRIFFMNWFTRRLKGWRTVIANLLMALMPVLELTEITQVLPSAWLPWYALAMALMNMGLRAITTSPMGQNQ